MSQKPPEEPTKSKICLSDDDDDFVKIDVRKELFHQAYACFNDLRANCQFCDIVLISQGKRLSAHKVILAAAIPYFRLMFTTDMIEATKKEIHLNELEYETVEQLVTYAYTGELRITTSNVQSLIIGANFFQLVDVVNCGSKFLISRLHASNALSICSFCEAMSTDKKIMRLVESFVQKHFLAVSREDEFLMLDVNEVSRLLANDELYVNSEEDVFIAAIRWLQHDTSRHNLAARVLSGVRLPLLKPSYLSDTVATHQLIKGDLACRDLVDEAKDYHLIPERRCMYKSFRCLPRFCRDVPGLIFAIGGLKPCESRSTVEIFDPLTKKWTGAKEMSTLRTRVGVAVDGRQVYAIGGFNGHDRLKLVEVYDYNLNMWTAVAPLARKRSALAATFLNNKLYVCGGYDGVVSLASVEIFNPEKNIWCEGPEMLKQRSASGVSVLDGYIYVMGGHDGMSIFNGVERFDPDRNCWESMPPMLSKRCRLGAATYNGKIYACGGYDGTTFLRSVEVFDPKTMRWSFTTPMNMARSRVSLAGNTDGLYAIAGFDGENNLCSVEVFREETQQWELTTPLQTHEGGVGVGIVPIPPDRL